MIIMLYYIYKMLLDIQPILHQCPNIYLFRMKQMVRSKLISVTKFVFTNIILHGYKRSAYIFEDTLNKI